MANKISRREILGLGAATIAAASVCWGKQVMRIITAAARCNISRRPDNRNLRVAVRIGRRATAEDRSM